MPMRCGTGASRPAGSTAGSAMRSPPIRLRRRWPAARSSSTTSPRRRRAAELRAVLHPRRRGARRLQALSRQRPARGFRPARHADPADAAREGEPVRGSQMNDAGAEPCGPGSRRQAAVVFIFVTVVLDMLALGMVIPVLPILVEKFLGGDTARASEVFGLFATAWAAMQFLFSPVQGALSDRFGRRPVILISNFGLGLDYIFMALAPSLAWLFVGRVISGHHGGEHLDGLCLYRRRHAAGEPRQELRPHRRGVRHRLRAGTGARRPARRHRPARAVLGRGRLEPRQRDVRVVRPARVPAPERRAPFSWRRANPGRARSSCCARIPNCSGSPRSISSPMSRTRCCRPSPCSTWRIAMASTNGRWA